MAEEEGADGAVELGHLFRAGCGDADKGHDAPLGGVDVVSEALVGDPFRKERVAAGIAPKGDVAVRRGVDEAHACGAERAPTTDAFVDEAIDNEVEAGIAEGVDYRLLHRDIDQLSDAELRPGVMCEHSGLGRVDAGLGVSLLHSHAHRRAVAVPAKVKKSPGGHGNDVRPFPVGARAGAPKGGYRNPDQLRVGGVEVVVVQSKGGQLVVARFDDEVHRGDEVTKVLATGLASEIQFNALAADRLLRPKQARAGNAVAVGCEWRTLAQRVAARGFDADDFGAHADEEARRKNAHLGGQVENAEASEGSHGFPPGGRPSPPRPLSRLVPRGRGGVSAVL